MLRKIEKSIFLSKPIIGIVTRLENNMHKINKSLIDNITKCGGLCLGIINEERYSCEFLDRDKLIIDNILKICDGFVIPGGSTESYLDKYIIEYATKNNIPILGICLGMQEIGCLFGGRVVKANHLHHSPLNRVHKVYINKKSKLYQITGTDKMLVNSRHHDRLICSHLYVSAISEDGVIEAIEIPGYKFCIGVQWHPENLITFDKYSQSLFKEFINSCKE